MKLDLSPGVHPMYPLCSAPSHPLRDQFRVSVFSNRSNAVLLMRPSLQDGISVSSNLHRAGCVPAMAVRSLGAPWHQTQEDASINSGGSRSSAEVTEIAVLDMGAYFSDEAGARECFAENLREQCHRVGLFYVKNHGVSQELSDKMLAIARQFFHLPSSVKVCCGTCISNP